MRRQSPWRGCGVRDKERLIQPDRQCRHVYYSGNGDLGTRRGGGVLHRALILVRVTLVLTGLVRGMVTGLLGGDTRSGLHSEHAAIGRGRALAKQHQCAGGARYPTPC